MHRLDTVGHYQTLDSSGPLRGARKPLGPGIEGSPLPSLPLPPSRIDAIDLRANENHDLRLHGKARDDLLVQLGKIVNQSLAQKKSGIDPVLLKPLFSVDRCWIQIIERTGIEVARRMAQSPRRQPIPEHQLTVPQNCYVGRFRRMFCRDRWVSREAGLNGAGPALSGTHM
ncbi:hypothetical protein [Jannaschia seosinensis]|uniref:hypothetical protein n=1 Tax=Jannaschia seosinensis TaxID=313367 RepID=UPI00118752EA|nr:hypothetical protein [Jannaschia seosinensis]